MASRKTRQLLDLLDGFEMTKSQHDWLERRFENMTVKESLLFRGAMQIEQPRMACDVMLSWANSSWNRSSAPLIKRGSFLTRGKWVRLTAKRAETLSATGTLSRSPL